MSPNLLRISFERNDTVPAKPVQKLTDVQILDRVTHMSPATTLFGRPAVTAEFFSKIFSAASKVLIIIIVFPMVVMELTGP